MSSVTSLEFRRVMRHLPTGITVVASRRPGDEPCGLTANTVVSVSLEPLLVLVCLDRGADTHDCVIERGEFAVSVLEAGAEGLARRFADPALTGEKFVGVTWRGEETGSPILEGALAWLDCRVWRVVEAGDHSVVIGEVVACGARSGRPLLFWRGRYQRLDG